MRLLSSGGREPTFWGNSGLGGDLPSSTKYNQESEHSPPFPSGYWQEGRVNNIAIQRLEMFSVLLFFFILLQ